jgi:hypothetical protein
MNKHVRQALPSVLLIAAVPLIPIFAPFIVPHQSVPACIAADCRAFPISANSFHVPAAIPPRP